jgi:Protein of unknown function (DUF4246)
MSYINNLHPEEHPDLYAAVEDVLAASIPLWDMTLAPCAQQAFIHSQRITFNGADYDPDPEEVEEEDGPLVDDNDDGTWDFREEWKSHIRRTVLPEPEEFDPGNLESPEPYSLKEQFGNLGRPLQVIVKLANIELTPEKPDYEGGTWHVEGKLVSTSPTRALILINAMTERAYRRDSPLLLLI